MRRPDLAWLTDRPFAHRGLHNLPADIPENTLRAAEAAIAAGLGIECDVQLTADGEAIVFHDETLRRLAGVDEAVAATTLSDMQRLRILGSDEAPPSLAELTTLIGGRVPLLIELKSHGLPGPLEAAALRVLRPYTGPAAVFSFSPQSMRWFRQNAPDIVRGQISGSYRRDDDDLSAVARFARRHLLTLGISRPHFVAHEVGSLTMIASRLWRRFGGPLLTWTVRAPDDRSTAERHADNMIFEGFVPDELRR